MGITESSPRGLKVIEAKGVIGSNDVRRNEIRWAIVASTKMDSIIANPLPMQFLGPALKGK